MTNIAPTPRSNWLLPITFSVLSCCFLVRESLDVECFRGSAHEEWNVPFPSMSGGQVPNAPSFKPYKAAPTERYVMGNLRELGYETNGNETSSGCKIWTESGGGNPIYDDLQQFNLDLIKYLELVKLFESPYKDIRQFLHGGADICDKLSISPTESIEQIFHGQLSSGRGGYMEPMLPPFRSSSICTDFSQTFLKLDYLVHDFVAICRNLLPSSRIVLLDLGASLDFFGNDTQSPALYLTSIFKQFGMPFDHIYAFEITPTDPGKVYELIPNSLRSSYHWNNVGISKNLNSTRNPWNLIRDNFDENDLVVVKLDIDTPWVENPLARQLVTDKRLHLLVDHFYFEHHVYLEELYSSWSLDGNEMDGSVADSFRLFQSLRKVGIAAHSWV